MDLRSISRNPPRYCHQVQETSQDDGCILTRHDFTQSPDRIERFECPRAYQLNRGVIVVFRETPVFLERSLSELMQAVEMIEMLLILCVDRLRELLIVHFFGSSCFYVPFCYPVVRNSSTLLPTRLAHTERRRSAR